MKSNHLRPGPRYLAVRDGRNRSTAGGMQRRASERELAFERLENRCVMSANPSFAAGAIPLPTDPTTQVSGAIAQPCGQQSYQVTLDTQGLLVANVDAPAVDTLLSLQDDRGKTLIQSEASSPTNPEDRIAQHLPAGTYYLSVSATVGVGRFELATTFTASMTPGRAIGEGQGAYRVTAADINGDGKTDLVVADYDYNQILINYGLGDGTFQAPIAIPVGTGPTDVVAASLSGDGHLDLVVVDQLSNNIMILKGDGRGDFQVSQVLATRPGPIQVVTGDFAGDGSLDLAVAESGANGVQIFHNLGNGTFVAASFIGSISDPTSLAVADVGGDLPGLAVASGGSGNLILFDGEGADAFTPLSYQLPVGAGVSDVIAANFSGGSRPDLAAVSPDTGLISIFHYDGFAYRLRGTLKAGTTSEALVAADFNGDGHLDLAVANYGSNTVSIFLGNGEDTFGAATNYATGSGPIDLSTSDFNGDGYPDLVTSNFVGLTFSLLINNGNATFQNAPAVTPSAGPEDVAVADLTGNGILDLIVPDFGLDAVSIFLGRGDGTFRDPIEVPAGTGAEDVAVGDFNGDGIPDLAVADATTNTITILQGNGDGTFQKIGGLATGDGPEFIKTADLDDDGQLDLVVANYLDNTVDVFYGLGHGKFSDAVVYQVGLGPSGIAISDLNGNGKLDIAVSDSGSNSVDVFINIGHRTFAPPISYPTGAQPWEVTAGRFNNGGEPDLVVSNGLSSLSSVSLLVNTGNGTFLPPVSFGVGGSPFPVAVGDFTGNGNLDVVTGNDGTNDLSVLLGNGNGTFEPEIRLTGGIDPYGVAVGDFNGDGHLDIVSVNYQSSDLIVYMNRGDATFGTEETIPLISPDLPTITADLEGNGIPQVIVADPQAGTISVYNSQGDGTLQLLTTIVVGGSPSGLVAGDFNGDGRPDLAVTDASSGEVLILLGLGDGTFESPLRYAVGKSPRSPVVGDFDHNGILDIAVTDTNSDQVSVLMGRGDGTFEATEQYSVGLEPIFLEVGDVNGDGYLDLGTVNRSSNDITELFGMPGGNFVSGTIKIPGIIPSVLTIADFNCDGQPDLATLDDTSGMVYVALDYVTNPQTQLIPFQVGTGNTFMVAADLYHDGKSDLVLANADTGVVTVLSGWVNGKFQNKYTFNVNVAIAGLSVVDLNNDGLPDILITEAGTGQIQTYLSGGDGVFSAAESILPLPHPAPVVYHESSPGVSDILTLDNSGGLLLRLGVDGAVAEFSAPIDETTGTSIAIRDYANVQTGGLPEVAAIDTQRPVIYILQESTDGQLNTVVLPLPSVGNYTRLIAADLFGTGRDDIVVINRTLDEIIIFQQTSSGVFSQYGEPISAGFGPTDVTLAKLNPGGLPDLVIADGSSGTVTLVERTSQGGFFVGAVLPAGLATAGTVLLTNGLNRTSPDQTVGVTSGVFGTSGLADVAVVDHGTDQISILQGLPGGGLSAPSLALTYSTGLDPIQVVAVSLTHDGLLDLVVLNEGSQDISIFLNNGHGGFTAMPRVDAGDNPTSLAVSDVTGDGVPDLVVSNTSGDVLILAGNGDGTFQPYERADSTVSLAAGDLTGNGQTDFVLTNTAQDLLTVQTSKSAAGFNQGRGDGLLAPGPVAIADMTGNGISDLIVVNTGGNDVFVYLGLGNGQFAPPQRFFTGTSPVGLTVADLTGNGLPDLVVANSGSNDVTILLGKINPDGSWTMVPGPRLKVGDRPVSTTVADVYGNGVQDIVVVDQGSDDLTVLRGLGGGFFNDTSPQILATGLSPVQAFVGHFSASVSPGIVVLNSLSDDMTYYANINANAVAIASGGTDPLAGVMGNFNNDGYADLAVANNGDSRITLFDGGPVGLTLAQSVSLGNSAHPTDLVVSGTKDGELQFYVGAEGQDRAIPIYFTWTASAGEDGMTQSAGSLVTTGVASRSSETTGTSGTFGTVAIEESSTAAGVQGQDSVQASGSSGGASGAFGQAGALVTALAQAAQPLFAPTARSLVWLIDNFVQLGQNQDADILPLGKNELAAVAVLLAASSMTTPDNETGGAISPVPTEDEATVRDVPLVVQGSPSPSRLDRYISNFEASIDGLSLEIAERIGRGQDLGPEWIWHRRVTGTREAAQGFSDGLGFATEDRPTTLVKTGLETQVMTGMNLGLSGLPSDSIDVERGASLPWMAILALAAGVAITTGMVAWKKLDRKPLIDVNDGTEGEGEPSPPTASGSGKVRNDRSSLPSRSRSLQDLPPWLQTPTSSNFRWQTGQKGYAASLFRKRS